MREDWVSDELGNLFHTTSGGTPSRRNDDYYKGSILWVKSGELDKGVIFDTEEKISEDAVKNSSAKIFPKGTLLIALYGAMIGKLAFLGVDAATNQAICGIFKNENIDSKFLYNFLLFRRRKLISQGTGGAQPNISQTILKKLEFPFPSKPVQRAIVVKIENLFVSLDKGIADLKIAQQQLKVYRQAVLKKAFEGNCQLKRLGELADIIGGVTKGQKLNTSKTKKLPYLRVANVQDGFLNLETIKYIEVLPTDLEKYRLLNEDVLFTEGGDRDKLGRGTVWKNEIVDCIHQNHIFRARVIDKQTLNPYYLTYYAQSPDSKGFFFKNGKHTTNLASINKTVLSNLLVPVRPIRSQVQIVKEIESRLSVCDKVEQNIGEALEKAEALRQSILKKAFDGNLLSEAEIARCKQEADYEPASELLKRIKKEVK